MNMKTMRIVVITPVADAILERIVLVKPRETWNEIADRTTKAKFKHLKQA